MDSSCLTPRPGGQLGAAGAARALEFHHTGREPTPSRASSHTYSALSPEDSFTSSEEDAPPPGFRGHVRRIVASEAFTYATAGVIMANIGDMAIETDYPGWHGLSNQLVQGMFLSFFVTEIGLRVIDSGIRGLFCQSRGSSQERYWNIFDCLIVALGVLDFVFTSLDDHSDPKVSKKHRRRSQIVLMIRGVRILRVIRALRLIRQFHQLYLLGRGLVESIQSVFWILLMYMALGLLSAIICVTSVGDEAEIFDHPDMVTYNWGSVLSSMRTLFQFVTLDDWATIAREVGKQKPIMFFFFMLYIVVAVFWILSLLTGIMADRMNSVRIEEEELQMKDKRKELRALCDELRREFREVDSDSDSKLSHEEFHKLFCEHPDNVEKLKALGVHFSTEDSEELFKILDHDRTGEVTWEEFHRGFLRLHGGDVGAKDLMKVQGAIERTFHMAKKHGGKHRERHEHARRAVSKDRKAWADRVDSCALRADMLSRRMESLERTIYNFMGFMGFTPGESS